MDHHRMFSLILWLSIIGTFLITNVGASHIRTKKVTEKGEVETNEGPRRYTTEAFLSKPIVCWEDLVKDGLTVDLCTDNKIRFVGDIDEEDFKKGNVLTFPVEDYNSFGCPMPPHSSQEKDPEVIFRIIIAAEFGDGKVTVHTRFIDPGKVVPTIMLHMGKLVHPVRTAGNYTTREVDLHTSSRVNNIGVRNFRRSGRTTLISAVTLSYSLTASGGVCSFRFDILRRQVTWEHRIDISASVTLAAAVAISRSASGEIFEVPIPGAGFSIRIFLLGRVTAGFTAALRWELNLRLAAAASVTFSARLSAGRRVVLGIGRISSSALPTSGSSTSARLSFNTNVAAAATASGFAGVRPVLAVGLRLPVIPDASLGIGATVGLAASIGFRSTKFRPASGGVIIGSACRSCHFVQGTLDVQGRRLSIEAEAPILGRREIIIASTLFSVRIGTLCFFATTCPARRTIDYADPDTITNYEQIGSGDKITDHKLISSGDTITDYKKISSGPGSTSKVAA